MTPTEQAIYLIHKFAKPIDLLHKYPMCYDTSKQCAIISVDEILDVIDRDENYQNTYSFFLEVKQEIEKL